MSTLKSRDVYVDRMHRVIEHIDQNLDQFLDLETLAEVAHFSPFHFHRLFSAWMGETLGGYLRRGDAKLRRRVSWHNPGLVYFTSPWAWVSARQRPLPTLSAPGLAARQRRGACSN